jgi:Zn-dependent metalloprotease
MKTGFRMTGMAVAVVLLIGLLATPVHAEPRPQGPEPPPPDGSSDATSAGSGLDIEGAALISYHSETGKVRFVGTEPGKPIPRLGALARGVTPEAAARGFLAAYGDQFGLRNQDRELTVMRERAASRGRSVVRFQQVYQSVPVIAGELIVQLDAENNVVSANGEILPDVALDVVPEIDAETARLAALEATAKQYDLAARNLVATEPELAIYNPALLGGPGPRVSTLVWRAEVTSVDLLPINQLLLVDAQRGFITLQFNQVDTVLDRRVYDNQNNPAFGLPGNGPVRTEGSAVTGILDVDNIYDYSGATYDYYGTIHGRDSLDGLGLPLTQTVRYCPDASDCPYDNAYWNGVQMVFGDGYPSADDVVAHEMTHGVTDYESNLFYYMQSGAINEAFSDIWGEFIDQSYTNGNDTDGAGVDWLMGEDAPGGALRSMSNPPAFGDPDRMGSAMYYCGTADNGGVHWNSGVGNKAAFLMAAGGAFNGYTVSGIGNAKTAAIFYEVQTNMLTSGSDYRDLHNALDQACSNLIGTGAITGSDCQQVREAISAVEMNQQPAGCAVDHAPICDNIGFDSQFNVTASGWYAVAIGGDWYVDANYLWSYGSATDAFFSVATNNSYSDFEYQAQIRRYGAGYAANGVMIRGTPAPLGSGNRWDSGYGFFYSRDGSFSVWKYVGGSFVSLQGWTYSEAINTGDAWNTLRVVARGPQLFYYINGDLVWSGTDSTYATGQVGLIFYRGTGSVGDEFQVDWATSAGGTPLTLFFDDLESGPGNWTSAAAVGSDEWYYDWGYAHSGARMLYGYDQPSVSDFAVAMNSDVPLPANRTAYLHFHHAYDFESYGPPSYYDGGVVEYSTNGGGSWFDLGPMNLENGYNGTLISSPLDDRDAYVAESYGYLSSRFNLDSLKGQNVRFRYRIGTDSSVDDLGWVIDDVRVYTCVEPARRVYLPLVLRGYPPTGFNLQFTWSSAGWQVHSGAWNVDGDSFWTQGLPYTSSSASYTAPFANFDYRVRLRRTGCSTCANRLMVRGAPEPLQSGNYWYSYYSFQYTNDGDFSVWKRVAGGSSTALQGWTPSAAIATGGAWNMLRVVANGTNLSFYINGSPVWSGSDSSLASGRVGVGMYDGGSAHLLDVDWATLTALGTASLSAGISAEQPALNETTTTVIRGDENRVLP